MIAMTHWEPRNGYRCHSSSLNYWGLVSVKDITIFKFGSLKFSAMTSNLLVEVLTARGLLVSGMSAGCSAEVIETRVDNFPVSLFDALSK